MLHLKRGNYLGAVRSRWTFTPAQVVETTYASGQRLTRHSHRHVYLAVVTAGALREHAHRHAHELSRGQVVFNDAGEDHEDLVLADGTRCLNLELRPDFLKSMEAEGFRPRAPLLYSGLGAGITALGRLQAALGDPGGDLDFEEALVELLLAVSAAEERRPRGRAWLPRTLELLHDGSRGGVSLDRIASVAGLHRTHLCRAFRVSTGCTIGEYVRRLRADRAHEQLRAGALPLAAVAADCGYSDQSHMTRELRRLYGSSPSGIRRRRANPVQDPDRSP